MWINLNCRTTSSDFVVSPHGHWYCFELCIYLWEKLTNSESGEALSLYCQLLSLLVGVESHLAHQSRELHRLSLWPTTWGHWAVLILLNFRNFCYCWMPVMFIVTDPCFIRLAWQIKNFLIQAYLRAIHSLTALCLHLWNTAAVAVPVICVQKIWQSV